MQENLIYSGTIVKYDEKSLTVKIQPDSGGLIDNVRCPFERFDTKNNAYSFRAPSDNSRCLFTKIRDIYYLLCLIPARNFSEEGFDVKDSSCGNNHNMTPIGWPEGKIVKAGEVTDVNANGSEDTFSDTMKKIIIVPKKLESLWNILNCIWTNTCTIFRLFSAPLDITAEVTEEEECNTTVKVRKVVAERKEDATTMVDLRMGKDADIIQLNINDKPFLHIDGDRNILLIAKKIDINAEQINYNVSAGSEEGHNGEVNMLNVDTVYLP